jgi:hypothetical protein
MLYDPVVIPKLNHVILTWIIVDPLPSIRTAKFDMIWGRNIYEA